MPTETEPSLERQPLAPDEDNRDARNGTFLVAQTIRPAIGRCFVLHESEFATVSAEGEPWAGDFGDQWVLVHFV